MFVDSYENLKRLRPEAWFKDINFTSGIWLGNGLENQNLFGVNTVDMEDRKLNFEGEAFVIEDGKYTLIKSVMDKE